MFALVSFIAFEASSLLLLAAPLSLPTFCCSAVFGQIDVHHSMEAGPNLTDTAPRLGSKLGVL